MHRPLLSLQSLRSDGTPVVPVASNAQLHRPPVERSRQQQEFGDSLIMPLGAFWAG